MPPAVEVQSLNHWTAREVPLLVLYYFTFHINAFDPPGTYFNVSHEEQCFLSAGIYPAAPTSVLLSCTNLKCTIYYLRSSPVHLGLLLCFLCASLSETFFTLLKPLTLASPPTSYQMTCLLVHKEMQGLMGEHLLLKMEGPPSLLSKAAPAPL